MKKLLLIPIIFLLCGCISPRVNPFDDPIKRQEMFAKIINEANIQKNEYLKLHPNTSPQVRKSIFACQVILGMTKDEVAITWGYPGDIKSIETERKIIDIWEYDIPGKDYKFMNHYKLYFKDGSLVKIKNKT